MKLRHFAAVALAGVLALGLGACGGQGSSTQASPEQTQPKTMEVDEAQKAIKVREDLDKYTRYLRNYVGMNLANVGKESTNSSDVQTDDGEFVDVSSMEVRKGYYVVSQDPAPDTEVKFTYEVGSDGKEVYKTKTVNNVKLHVAKVPGYNPSASK